MTERKVSGYLGKTLFMQGHKCHKSLWLHKHRPELATEADEALQAKFRSGHEIGGPGAAALPGRRRGSVRRTDAP